MKEENMPLANFNLDIELQPNGKFDMYLSEECSSGAHYSNVTIEDITSILKDQILEYRDQLLEDTKIERPAKKDAVR